VHYTQPMIRTLIVALATLAVIAAPAAAEVEPAPAANAVSDYQIIVERNPFGLKDPPPAAPPPAPPPAPKSDIFLTGITTFLQPKKAYLMTKDPQGKMQYYSFKETDAADGLEMLEINERDKSVRIRRDGEEMLLTFDKNGVKPPPAAAPPAPGAHPPGMPNPGGPPVPGQPGQPAVNYPQNLPSPPGLNPNTRTLPSRTMRVQPDMQTGAGFDVNVGSGANADYRAVIRGRGVDVIQNTPQSPQQQGPKLSAEEQLALIELQRASNPNIQFPPMPNVGGAGGPPPLPGQVVPPPIPGQ
jgi:hypothetical protein